ncbi:MAG: ROK family protein [Bryobacterales bacterium]|nr:ROK family protein [Bryobacterales bacterium]
MFACVDLGGTTISAGLGDAAGQLTAQRTIDTESHRGPAGVLERMAGLVESLGARPEAVGIGVPGLIDFASGSTLCLPNFPTQWRGVGVREMLAPRLGCPVYLLNDARAATLGELRFGHGRHAAAPTMVFFTLGTGIGGGIVIDGRLRMGPLGAAGETGHQTIDPNGALCGCGNHGCLEAIASAPALTGEGVRLLRSGQAPRLHEITGGDAARVTPKTMAEAADPAVREAILRVARALGIAAANLVTSLHPDLVVFGGGMAALGDELLLAPVRDEIRARVRMFPPDNVRVERSLLGDQAGLLGALALAAAKGTV